MIDRWVIVDCTDGTVHSEGYVTEQDAWKAQVELAREQKRSPYEWKVCFEVR
jgi:hypothetical protein